MRTREAAAAGLVGSRGSRGVAFIGAERGLGVRATPSRGGARSVLLPDSGRVRVLPEVGDDGRAPRDRGREGAGPDWARRRGTGRRKEYRAAGKSSGPRGGVKEKPFSFSETKQTLSI